MCVYTLHAKIPEPDESFGHLRLSPAQEVSYPLLLRDLYFLSASRLASHLL